MATKMEWVFLEPELIDVNEHIFITPNDAGQAVKTTSAEVVCATTEHTGTGLFSTLVTLTPGNTQHAC